MTNFRYSPQYDLLEKALFAVCGWSASYPADYRELATWKFMATAEMAFRTECCFAMRELRDTAAFQFGMMSVSELDRIYEGAIAKVADAAAAEAFGPFVLQVKEPSPVQCCAGKSISRISETIRFLSARSKAAHSVPTYVNAAAALPVILSVQAQF